MPKFQVSLPVRGRLTRVVEAKDAAAARVKAKHTYEEMPITDEMEPHITDLTIGDVDDFRIEEADHG